MDFKLKVERVESDRAQAIYRYYMKGESIEVVVELPKRIPKLQVRSVGTISLIKVGDSEPSCDEGLLLQGRVLSADKKKKKAIFSFGGLLATITFKNTLPNLSEGLKVRLCLKGFGIW